MAKSRVEGDHHDLSRQIDDGIQRNTLLAINEAAFTRLQTGRLQARLDIFLNRHLIERAMAIPDLADKVLANFCSDRFRLPFGDRIARVAERLNAKQSSGATEHFYDSHLAVQGALTELANTTTNLEVRAKILAVVCRELGRQNYHLAIQKESGKVIATTEDIISRKVLRQLESLTRVPQPYSPGEMAQFLDTFGTGLSRADWEIAPLDRRDTGFCAMFIGSHIMEHAAAAQFPQGATQFDVEEFFGDTALWAKTDFSKAAISGYWDKPESKTTHDPLVAPVLWNKLIDSDKSLMSGRDIGEYAAALFDDKHSNHSRALRIVRKWLVGVTPADALIYTRQLIEGVVAMAEPVPETIDPTRQAASLAGRKRYQALRRILENILGQQAGRALDGLYDEIVRNSIRVPNERTWRAHVVQPPTVPIRYDRLVSGNDSYLRVTQVVSPDMLQVEHCFRREPGVEVEYSELTQLTDALIYDIKESRVALVERTVVLSPDVKLTVTPKPNDFPACDITLVTDNYYTTISLDNKLAGNQTESTEITEMMRSLAVAVLHDQLSYTSVTGTETRAAPSTIGADSEPPAHRPVRVHQADKYIIMTDQPEDPTVIKPSVRITDSSAVVHVERRPHWSDRAPQLTSTARALALEEFIETHPTIDKPTAQLLHTALTGKEAHRLTIRRILTDLYDDRRHSKRLLPTDFPLADALDQLPQLEEDYYAMALEQYLTSNDGAPAGPLPRIFTVAERMAKDQTAMAQRGLHGISVPPRQRSTETYVSSTHFEVPLTIAQSGTGRAKGYTVIEAESATQAMTRLLKLSLPTAVLV